MEKITVEVFLKALLKDAWKKWTDPEAIINWNFASNDWCCPKAINALRNNGKFSYRMEAKDGSFGFDFSGEYLNVVPYKKITYKLGDEREVEIEFIEEKEGIKVKEIFDPERVNSIELQRTGWQAILDNYKKFVERK